MSNRTARVITFLALVALVLVLLGTLSGCSVGVRVDSKPVATTAPTAPVATTPPVTTSSSPIASPVTVTVTATATKTVTVTQQPTTVVKPKATSGASLDPLLSQIPVLKSIGGKCPIAYRDNYPPTFNDGGNGYVAIGVIALYQPTVSAIRCAQGRLRVGGFTLLTPEQQLQHPSIMTSPRYRGMQFHMTWARIGHNNSAACVFPFTVMDYQGNVALFNDGEPVGMDRDGYNMVNWNAAHITQQVQAAFDNC